ncbi:MAG: tetratricopeptide repeat protein, partial [Desulfobacterales bacterium]
KEYKRSLRYPFLRYGVIASLGILGMFLSLADAKKRLLLYGVVGICLVSGLLFLVQSRYRTPAVPYFCLFAGHTIYCLYQGFKRKDLRSTALIVLFVPSFLYLSHSSFKGEIEHVDVWQKATKIHYKMGAIPLFAKGKYNEAIIELNTCISIAPKFSPAYNLRGKTHAMLGRFPEAEQDFKSVLELSPNIIHGYKNLGFLYLIQGNKEKAKTYLEAAN